MSYLGLDIGTSGCKSVVFDAEGATLASAYRAYPVLTPEPGHAELDSNEVMGSCLAVIKETAVAAAGKGDPVSGISISSQGEAFTPVDSNGAIIGNGMVSSDARAAGLVERVASEFGGEKLYEITGHTAYSMFTLFKLLWLKENRADIWNAAAGFHCYEDLMCLKMGLKPAISWPLAGRTMNIRHQHARLESRDTRLSGFERVSTRAPATDRRTRRRDIRGIRGGDGLAGWREGLRWRT
ncbi:MAG: hypothetical protein GXP32_02010 [Kiritimatiellaeota bacterium]|nr:hypothetical protein [Kiritimatiellota bacterium]